MHKAEGHNSLNPPLFITCERAIASCLISCSRRRRTLIRLLMNVAECVSLSLGIECMDNSRSQSVKAFLKSPLYSRALHRRKRLFTFFSSLSRTALQPPTTTSYIRKCNAHIDRLERSFVWRGRTVLSSLVVKR